MVNRLNRWGFAVAFSSGVPLIVGQGFDYHAVEFLRTFAAQRVCRIRYPTVFKNSFGAWKTSQEALSTHFLIKPNGTDGDVLTLMNMRAAEGADEKSGRTLGKRRRKSPSFGSRVVPG